MAGGSTSFLICSSYIVSQVPFSKESKAEAKMCRWTPYLFLEDGRLNHTGTNVFNMWKTESKGWIITGIADIAREVDEKAFDAFGEAEEWKKSQSSQ